MTSALVSIRTGLCLAIFHKIMLYYMRTRQAPRKYPVPEEDPAASTRNPCNICVTRIWTPDLFTALRNSPATQRVWNTSYLLSSQELRESVIGGCDFCRSIADGIHGRIFLDDLYERFLKNRSNSNSGSSESSDLKDKTHQSECSGSDQEDSEDGWNDASAFNEEEIEDDVTGGWDSWNDRDTLTGFCDLEVRLSFDRGSTGVFTFLNVRIEATGKDENVPDALGRLSRPRAVELRYYINAQGSDNLDIPGLFLPRTDHEALGSDSNMTNIIDWMQRLSAMPHSNSLHVPARLIDLQNNGLRIVETSSLPLSDQSYVALSYVWGANQAFILLSTTQHSLMTGFSADRLPKTIQDAVTITRRIGMRYLWVDALCIMQDSNDDKARELPKMRLIYKSAAVTIIAAVAGSATEGFLHYIEEERAYSIQPITIPYPSTETREAQRSIILSYPTEYKRAKDLVNDRAWTFQELLLSTRAIVFSYRGVHMIDRTNIPAADGDNSGLDNQLPSLPWSGQMFSLDIGPENTRQVWLAVRGEYSRRKLSYEGDKLLAIAAVAEELGRNYKSRYLAGMWERDLAIDLQWVCPSNQNMNIHERKIVRKPRPEGYIAPSWSWASVDANVEDFVRVWEDSGAVGGLGIKSFLDFEVVSCKVELVVPDFEYGAVKSGILVVRGRLCSFIWRPHEDDDFPNNLESDGLLVRVINEDTPLCKDLRCGEATVDALDPELVDDVEVICLATRLIENVPGRRDVEGLMLLEVDETRYRRVGFFKLNGLAMFENCEVETVIII